MADSDIEMVEVEEGQAEEASIETRFTRSSGVKLVEKRRESSRSRDIRPPHVRQQESTFGEPCYFNENKLPTIKDVIRRLYLSYNDAFTDEKTSQPMQSFASEVGGEVIEIWKKTKIPLIA